MLCSFWFLISSNFYYLVRSVLLGHLSFNVLGNLLYFSFEVDTKDVEATVLD